jgi:hypothetical protein
VKIKKSILKRIIAESYRSEREMYYQGIDFDERDEIMRQMAEEDYESEVDEYESRHSEAQEQMYLTAVDALEMLIGNGISSEALVGQIRKNRDINIYSFETVMEMIESLDPSVRGNISGFLGID